MMVFVTLIRGMVAVATNANTAQAQLNNMLQGDAASLVAEAEAKGEIRRSVSVRIVHVEANQ
jgi:hypothetical protein